MNRNESDKLQVGFRDVASYGLGVAIPLIILLSTFMIAVAVSLNRNPGPALSVGMTTGLVLAIALEMLRRYVLVTQPAGGRTALKIFRSVIWLVVLGCVPVVIFAAVGAFTKCYGQTCGGLQRILLTYMLGWSILCLTGVPFGYRLLGRATWLQPR